MKKNRRDFLKLTGLTGIGLTNLSLIPGYDLEFDDKRNNNRDHTQHFNMSGYAAPKLETVRIGYVGLGNRGQSAVSRIRFIEGIEIKALCDKRMERVDETKKILAEFHFPPAKVYGGSDDNWKSLCEDPDIDLVYIATPRGLHAPIAIYAMEQGKHVATEMPAAITLEDAWQLVETSERTKKHCMMLENCCYDFFELLILNMVRQGFFGEIVHADAGYIHHQNSFTKTRDGEMWRLRESQHRNGNLYPTHGLGPVCQVMDINRGEKLDYMVSMSSDDFQMGKMAAELAKQDSFYEEFDTDSYRGNMNTSIIRTEKGRTIMLQYDITSARVYSRIQMISGTKGMSLKYPNPPRIAQGGQWIDEKEMEKITEEYTPKIVKHVGDLAKKVGGHGGMDFIMDWRLIDCLRNGLPLDQDVYDAALWSSIVPLSEWSVANHSKPIQIPDFTCGAYKTNTPVDINLLKGGNTGVRTSFLNNESV